ncbi:hypothetical protein ACFSTD_14500 [Novosphingobium colocasiae]
MAFHFFHHAAQHAGRSDITGDHIAGAPENLAIIAVPDEIGLIAGGRQPPGHIAARRERGGTLPGNVKPGKRDARRRLEPRRSDEQHGVTLSGNIGGVRLLQLAGQRADAAIEIDAHLAHADLAVMIEIGGRGLAVRRRLPQPLLERIGQHPAPRRTGGGEHRFLRKLIVLRRADEDEIGKVRPIDRRDGPHRPGGGGAAPRGNAVPGGRPA